MNAFFRCFRIDSFVKFFSFCLSALKSLRVCCCPSPAACPLCLVHSVLLILSCPLCLVHSVLSTLSCPFCPVHSVLYTLGLVCSLICVRTLKLSFISSRLFQLSFVLPSLVVLRIAAALQLSTAALSSSSFPLVAAVAELLQLWSPLDVDDTLLPSRPLVALVAESARLQILSC